MLPEIPPRKSSQNILTCSGRSRWITTTTRNGCSSGGIISVSWWPETVGGMTRLHNSGRIPDLTRGMTSTGRNGVAPWGTGGVDGSSDGC